MSGSDLDPMPPGVESLLATERAAPNMPSAAKARIAARIADLPPLTGVPADATAGPATSTLGEAAATAGSSAKWLVVVGISFGVGVGTGAGVYALLDEEPDQATPPVLTIATEPDSGIGAEFDSGITRGIDGGSATETTPSKLDPPALDNRAATTEQTAPRGADEPARARDQSLAAERAVIELARTSLRRGEVDATVAQLRRHERDYSDGRLREEREALWVQALVTAGNTVQARKRGLRFKQEYPQSLFLPIVEDALARIQ